MKYFIIVVAVFSISCGPKHTGAAGFGEGQEKPLESLAFIDDILPIIEMRCASCHNPSMGLPDFRSYEVIFNRRDIVRHRVFVIQDMPRDNMTEMTEEERELVAAWIDEGAFE